MDIEQRVKNYFGINYAGGGDYSPNGNEIVFVYDETGVIQIYKQKLYADFNPIKLTNTDDRCTNPVYLKNNDIIYLSDRGGNENFQIYVIRENKTFKLTKDDRAKHRFAFSSDNAIYLAANIENKQRFDIYRYTLPLSPDSKPELIVRGEPQTIIVPVTTKDNNGKDEKLLFNVFYGNMHVETFVYDFTSGEIINISDNLKVRTYGVDFVENGILVRTDFNREFLSLAVISDGKINFLEDDQWDTGRTIIDDKIYFEKNIAGSSKLFAGELNGYKLTNVMELTLPNNYGVLESKDYRLFLRSFVVKNGKILFTYSSPNQISNVWELDVSTNNLTQITFANGNIHYDFVNSDLLEFNSFDQLRVPYFIYRPKIKHKKYPAILLIHGGPEGQIRPKFNKVIQFFVSLGFAVVTPNIRGSSGYGRTYLSLDDRDKRLDSIADIKSLAEHLKTIECIDTSKLVVYGASYGGYAVLASITEYPETWAAAIDIVGISNFVTFLKNTASWRRKLREVEYGSLKNDYDMLVAISPIHKIHLVKAPTMVIQGDNDERVPLSEALQVYEKLKENNIPTQLLRFDDEGHGIVKRRNQIVMYTEIVKFLNKYVIKN